MKTNILNNLLRIIFILIFIGCSQETIKEVTTITNNPPLISITYPVNGTFVSGTINISGTASDSKGVKSVQISFDGGLTYELATGTTNWSYTNFDTTKKPDGNFLITVKAVNSKNIVSYDFVTVIIDNSGPTVNIVNPIENNQRVSGYVAIVGTSNKSDSVQVKIDNGPYQTATGVVTWYMVWDTTNLEEKSYTITARGIRNNTPGTEVTRTVFVDKTVPSIRFITPELGSYQKGTFIISGDATDDSGLDKVEISLDGGLTYINATLTKPGETNSGWSYSLNTLSPLIPDGAKTIYARAKDKTGLIGIASIPITIDNTNPSINITSHSNEDMVSDIVRFEGTASDSIGIDKVQIKIGSLPLTDANGKTNWSYDFDSKTLPNGVYEVYVKVTDYAGNFNDKSLNIVIDQNFPSIDSINVDNGDIKKGVWVLSGTASDNDGTSDIDKIEIKIGTTNYQLVDSVTPVDSKKVNWSKSIDTTGMNGEYIIYVKVTDKVGGYSVIYKNLIFDNTPPSITINSPLNNAQIAGKVSIAGIATDTYGINTINYEIKDITGDYTKTGSLTLNEYYWSFLWDSDNDLDNDGSPSLPQLGNYTIKIIAKDRAENIKEEIIQVTKTANAPSIIITSPSMGAYVKESINITGTANSFGTIEKVEIQIDNNPLQLSSGTNNWEYSLDTKTLSEGVHQIKAIVTDNIGTATSIITITVDNIKPVVSIINPTSSKIGENALYGITTINGSASDTNIDSVKIYIDGVEKVPVSGITFYSYNWDTATIPNGAKNGVVITAKAIDKAGNEATTDVVVDVKPYIAYYRIGGNESNAAKPGDIVTIYGYNLVQSSNNTIFYENVNANGGVVTGTNLRSFDVIVPGSARSGPIKVKTNGIESSNGVHINIWGIINAFSPPLSGGATTLPNITTDKESGNIYMVAQWKEAGNNSQGIYFSKYRNNSWSNRLQLYYTDTSANQRFDINSLDVKKSSDKIYVVFFNSRANPYVNFGKATPANSIIVIRLSDSDNPTVDKLVFKQLPALATYISLDARRNATSGKDEIYISYYSNNVLNMISTLDLDTDEFTSTPIVVDNDGNVGQYNTLKLTTERRPVISYYDATNRNLKFAYYNGTNWNISNIETGLVGQYTNMVIGTNNSIHISYYDGNNGNPRYAYAASPISSFICENIYTIGITGWNTKIALDKNNKPHVTFFDFTFTQSLYANKKSGTWEIVTIPLPSSSTTYYPIDGDHSTQGYPIIAFVEGDKPSILRFVP